MRRTIPLLGAIMLVLALASPASATSGTPANDRPVDQSEKGGKALSRLDSGLRAAVEAARLGNRLPKNAMLQVRAGMVRVEILHHLSSGRLRSTVHASGGQVTIVIGRPGDGVVEALVPLARVASLSQQAGIDFIRLPLQANIVPMTPRGSRELGRAGDPATQGLGAYGGEAVTKTNASAWQAAGYTGTGIKVGIIDFFNETGWSSAAAAGELPAAPAGTFCRNNGVDCSGTFWTFSSNPAHGNAVAEVIADQAPSASIYLATVVTTADLQAAVNYFETQGVDIISRSLTADYDGPGNGLGPIADVINTAVSKGMAWFNSAGNSAGATGAGAYWRGPWRDTDGDGWLGFDSGGTDELLSFDCKNRLINGLRWSDWSGSIGAVGATDYDAYVFDDASATILESSSEGVQGSGQPPLEHVSCSGDVDTDYLAVKLYSAGSGTSGDILEFMTNANNVQYSQNPYSASGPASDTASAGGMSVGAIDPVGGTTIASYSSRGPTNDGRIKPDLSAASCMSSYTYSPSCFSGTSAATPVAAGASALVLEAYPGTSPASLMTWLRTYAVVDRGALGADNDYGAGELVLPAPPTQPPSPAPSDFNGDGRSDLLWRHATTGEDYLWFMDGTTLSSSGPTLSVADTAWKVFGTPDLNGDGKADIIWRNSGSGQVYAWLMDGTTLSSSGSVFSLSDPDWKLVGTSDFDGDGKGDLLWRNASTGANYIWFMDGVQISSSGPTFTVADLSWKVVGTGDFDGNAKADIVWRNASTGQVYLWLMDGTTLSSSGPVFTLADANWQVVGTGDYDGNGKDDLLWRNVATGANHLWFMDGTSLSSSGALLGLPDLDWQVAGTGDYDGDGRADIAWRHGTTGQVYVWLMDGTTIVSHGATFTVADLGWQVVPSNPPSGVLYRAVGPGDPGRMRFTVSRRGAPVLDPPGAASRWWRIARPRTAPELTAGTEGSMSWRVRG